MSIVIDHTAKVICQGTTAPAHGTAVRVGMAMVLPHSFTYPAFIMQETKP